MILMLDIDGVLHPEPVAEKQFFCQLPILHQLLLALPEMQVVVTSDWRLRYSADELRNFLFHDALTLQKRFLGVTPSLPALRYEYRGREREVEMWLDKFGAQPWLAVDDVAGNYAYGSKNFYLTNYQTGIVEEDIKNIFDIVRR